MSNSEITYPHLIVRVIPAVYMRLTIVFEEGAETKKCESRQEALKGPMRVGVEKAWQNGRLTHEARRAMVEAALDRSVTSGFRMCVVSGPGRSIYVEPDGSVDRFDEPPRPVRMVSKE